MNSHDDISKIIWNSSDIADIYRLFLKDGLDLNIINANMATLRTHLAKYEINGRDKVIRLFKLTIYDITSTDAYNKLNRDIEYRKILGTRKIYK